MEQEVLVAEMRRFNRLYTRTVGLLEQTLTRSAFTLTEARVLFEVGHRASRIDPGPGGELGFLADAFQLETGPAASEIAGDLRLDPAYLTRILKKFASSGLTEARADPADGRRRILSLTRRGAAELARLQAAADADVAQLIGDLPEEKRGALGNALTVMMELLGGPAGRPRISIRPHRIGDVGWVVQRQARLYAQEYGWNIEFEALLAEIGADFIRNFQPGRDFCWIAEKDGLPVGAVFLVHDTGGRDAKLRMLHVEEAARGHGIGARLVDECVRQARASGYERLVLWTNDVLVAARKLYQRAGFRLVAQEKHHSFGKDLVGQNWELVL